MNIESERKLFLELQDLSLVDLIEYSKEWNIFKFKIANTNLDKGVELNKLNYGWKMWQASANREGFVLVANNRKTIVAIEQMVEQQVEASGMDSRGLERLDGWRIMDVIVEASQENKDE